MGPFCLNVNREEFAWSHHCVPCQWSNIVIPCLLNVLYSQYMTCILPENVLMFATVFCRNPSSRERRSCTSSIASTSSWEVQVRSIVLEKRREEKRGCSQLRAPSGVRLQSDISSERVEHLGKTLFLRLDAFLIWECPQRYTAFCLFRNDGREPEI